MKSGQENGLNLGLSSTENKNLVEALVCNGELFGIYEGGESSMPTVVRIVDESIESPVDSLEVKNKMSVH